MTDRIPTQPGSIVGDRYRVDRVVGVGSMSIVVAATHLEIERSVAIKFLNPANAQSDAIARFRREAQNAARLKNEHVARVIDIGALPGGLPFIVMDLVEGRSLREELLERGPFSAAEAVKFVLQAIEALVEAHGLGIVHRDLKPANLFLAERADRSRILKVLDFGVSKSLVDSPGADISALGALLHELVTGNVPYGAKSYAELCTLSSSDPPPTSRQRPDIPAEFDAVVRRCLASDREARFQSVTELANALAPFSGPNSQRVSLASSGFSGSLESPPGSPPGRNVRRAAVLTVALGALVAGGFLLYHDAASSESASNAVSQRAPTPNVVTTNAARSGELRPAGPSVTPVENGSVLPSTSAPSASRSVPVSQPRSAPAALPKALPSSRASSPSEFELTDFGGRK